MSGRRPPYNLEVEADGCISDTSQDPPGQASIYIMPGDVRREMYRLLTFERYPRTCLITRCKLAKFGFYFLGFKDRVKCFACGRTVENWTDDDDLTDKKWHKDDCPFQLGQECGNVPSMQVFQTVTRQGRSESSDELESNAGQQQKKQSDCHLNDSAKRIRLAGNTNQQPEGISIRNHSTNQSGQRVTNLTSKNQVDLASLSFNKELHRLASFAKWPIEKAWATPANLAKNGLFYLGDSDRTQCFSCGGVLKDWTPDDNISEKHKNQNPNCKMASGDELDNIPVDLSETEEERENNYPCRLAMNPSMESLASRLETFDHRWQRGRMTATPEEFAYAGMFYLGEEDRVKCFYCDGSLHTWEKDDDPWEEHAKWFPTCQFLLRRKGIRFIYHHLASNAHLPRQTVQSTHSVPKELLQNVETLPQTPQNKILQCQIKVQFAMENSETVKFVQDMGFEKEVIAQQLENYILSADQDDITEHIYESALHLVNDLIENEENLTRQVEEKNLTEESLIQRAKEEGWKEAMQKLADEKLCKICLVFPHNTVFIPCGHLCACLLCAVLLRTCPVCRGNIEMCVQTYEA